MNIHCVSAWTTRESLIEYCARDSNGRIQTTHFPTAIFATSYRIAWTAELNVCREVGDTDLTKWNNCQIQMCVPR